jgi:hypothetical protein
MTVKVKPEDVLVKDEWVKAYEAAYLASKAYAVYECHKDGLAVVLAMIANDPPVPTPKQQVAIQSAGAIHNGGSYASVCGMEYARIIFLRPKPVVPEALRGLLFQPYADDMCLKSDANEVILKAYEAGKAAGAK